MSDIVERLRRENSMPGYYGVPKLQADAADEIERLRTALEEVRYLVSGSNHSAERYPLARAVLATNSPEIPDSSRVKDSLTTAAALTGEERKDD